MELHVLLASQNIPPVAAWQTAIRAAGFDLTLDATLNLYTDTGFAPAVYRGQDTGFEFDLTPAIDLVVGDGGSTTLRDNRDRSANFRWGGDLTECAAATIAAAVLATITDGILYDPQDGTTYRDGAAIAIAQQTIQQIESLQSS